MRILRLVAAASLLLSALFLGSRAWAAQSGAPGSLDFTAYVRPSEGQAEPVRQMAFYLLSRSLSDIRKEIENTDGLVDLGHFVDQLSVSAELKDWMKRHHRVDLAGNDFIKELTAADVVDVPEFLGAYSEQNGAALHAVIPEPKYGKGEAQKNSEKYKLQREQYRQALRRYIQANLDSLEGIDAELRELNPYTRWIHVQGEQQRRIEQRVMQLAQTRYLVATTVTNLSGHAAFDNLAPGQYWISNLDASALAGDLRLRWDVAVAVAPAQTAHIELSNLNAIENSERTAR